MEDVQTRTAEQKLCQIKEIFTNFDANVPIFDFFEDGKFCSFVRVKDYLYLKSQINCVFCAEQQPEFITKKQIKEIKKEIREDKTFYQ